MKLVEKVKATIRDVHDYPKPGIVFKDITPLLANPVLMREVVKEIVSHYKEHKIDAVAAIEARGFIFGSIIAHELNCGFIPVRKVGKLPYQTKRQQYALEYGKAEIEMHIDAVKPGSKILIHDDLLATGGTASAAAELVKDFGGELAGFSFLINLNFLPGRQFLTERYGVSPQYLVEY